MNNIKGYWKTFLENENKKEYMKELYEFLKLEEDNKKTIFPPKKDIYNAYKYTPFENVKCCIIGQDPYFLEGLAHGLAFSVEDGVKPPRSLVNIYKELNSDLKITAPRDSGNLTKWTQQGVFLINSVLTVEENKAGSHRKKGWENLTKSTLHELNKKKENIVFFAWGRDAHKLCKDIDTSKHFVIKTSHPSPLGATKSGKDFDSFMGSNCFSKTNEWLISKGISPIDWSL